MFINLCNTQIIDISQCLKYRVEKKTKMRERGREKKNTKIRNNWLGLPQHIAISISFDILELEIPRVCFELEYLFPFPIKDFSESLYIEDNEHKPDVSFDNVAGYDNVRMDQCE